MKPGYAYTITGTASGEEIRKLALEAAEEYKADGNYEAAANFYAYANTIDVNASFRHIERHEYYAISDSKNL